MESTLCVVWNCHEVAYGINRQVAWHRREAAYEKGVNMKKKIAVVGYGGQGAWHASWALKSDVIALSGIYDIRQCRMDAATAAGIHTYPSLEALLADGEVDVVVCATPNDSHKDIVISALKAGKHVVCEKPVALSVGDFDEMCEAARAAGKIFTVHQNRRWDVDYLAIQSLVNSGEIGETVNIESRIHGSRGIPSDWRCHKPQGGGMILGILSRNSFRRIDFLRKIWYNMEHYFESKSS